MTANEYQQKVGELAMYPGKSSISLEQLFYPVLGLAGEVGEVTEHIKKYYRGDGKIDLDKIKLELGDVLWYLAELSRRLNISLQDIMESNIAKIEHRRIHGKEVKA